VKKIVALLCLGVWGINSSYAGLKTQDLATMQQTAKDFLVSQTAGLPGKVTITIGRVDSRLNLPACTGLTPFLLQGSKTWGKITMGIKCTAPKPWTIYLSAHVQAIGDYYVAATSLSQGQLINPNDIIKVSGDLSSLPVGVITDPTQIIGRSLSISLISGSPLRLDALKASLVVQQGQSIRVISAGSGFQVGADAIALNNAAEGQIAKAKMPSGQVISGIAKTGGVIDVSY
jgi:flagella basal body P-ring formation protein FlgA